MQINTETAIAALIYSVCCLIVAVVLTIKAPKLARWITNQQLYDRRRNYGGK